MFTPKSTVTSSRVMAVADGLSSSVPSPSSLWCKPRSSWCVRVRDALLRSMGLNRVNRHSDDGVVNSATFALGFVGTLLTTVAAVLISPFSAVLHYRNKWWNRVEVAMGEIDTIVPKPENRLVETVEAESRSDFETNSESSSDFDSDSDSDYDSDTNSDADANGNSNASTNTETDSDTESTSDSVSTAGSDSRSNTFETDIGFRPISSATFDTESADSDDTESLSSMSSSSDNECDDCDNDICPCATDELSLLPVTSPICRSLSDALAALATSDDDHHTHDGVSTDGEKGANYDGEEDDTKQHDGEEDGEEDDAERRDENVSYFDSKFGSTSAKVAQRPITERDSRRVERYLLGVYNKREALAVEDQPSIPHNTPSLVPEVTGVGDTTTTNSTIMKTSTVNHKISTTLPLPRRSCFIIGADHDSSATISSTSSVANVTASPTSPAVESSYPTSHPLYEPLLDPSLDEDRFLVFPIKYPDIFDLYKLQMAQFWTAEEINLSRDLPDWALLSDVERNFFKRILAFFAPSDGIVGENLITRFYDDVAYTEARFFYVFQAMMENIHAEVYGLLIKNLIPDEDEQTALFRAFSSTPGICEKVKWAEQWLHATDASFAERLVAFAVVEGLLFSGSFASIFWLKKRGLLPGLTFSNELISRDEGLHCDFACHLYTRHIRHRLTADRVYEIVRGAVNAEEIFFRAAFAAGPVGEMNEHTMIDYVKFCADRLLCALEVEPIFHRDNPFEFMHLISLDGRTNFFERRVGEYRQSLVSTNNLRDDQLAIPTGLLQLSADF